MNVGMDTCMNTVYASIPGMPELGMVWMGDMMVHGEPTHELTMLDPHQADNPYFPHGSHPFEDLSNRITPSTMVHYIPHKFSNECSEPDEAMEAIDAHEIQRVC